MASQHRLFGDIPLETDESQGDRIEHDIPVEVNNSVDKSSSSNDYMCTCCLRLFTRIKVLVFNENNYDSDNSTVKQFFSIRLKRTNIFEHICNRQIKKLIVTYKLMLIVRN